MLRSFSPHAGDDPRREEPGKEEVDPVDVVTFDSEEILRQKVAIEDEVTLMGDKRVTMLRDKENIYLVARGDSHILGKNTLCGGYGGGHVEKRAEATKGAVPFRLTHGDRTIVQLENGADTEEGADMGKAKMTTGTLYTVARSLDHSAASAGKKLKMTSYGEVIPSGVAGKHGYKFQYAEGSKGFEAVDYVVRKNPDKKTEKKSGSGAFFASFAARAPLEGNMKDMWRLLFDPVHFNLLLKKPFVVTDKDRRGTRIPPAAPSWI